MPFHDQPGLATRAVARAAHLRRERARERVTEILKTKPEGMAIPDIQPHLGITCGSIRKTLVGMIGDGLARRDRWDHNPRFWTYRLTPDGHTADHSDPAADLLASHRNGQRFSAAVRRARTRAAIMGTLSPWPHAHTARYIADHIGMSVSAVRRALAPLVDAGEVKTVPHPFNAGQRAYFLPRLPTGT